MILPFQALRYQTRLTPEEVSSALDAETCRGSWFRRRAATNYVGEVFNDHFRIRPSYSGRNQLTLTLRGSVTAGSAGSKILVRFLPFPGAALQIALLAAGSIYLRSIIFLMVMAALFFLLTVTDYQQTSVEAEKRFQQLIPPVDAAVEQAKQWAAEAKSKGM